MSLTGGGTGSEVAAEVEVAAFGRAYGAVDDFFNGLAAVLPFGAAFFEVSLARFS
jgi:hypothetical protein